MNATLRSLQPRSVGGKLLVFVVGFLAAATLIAFVDQVAPLVRNGFGDASWIVLASLRVLGFQVVVLAMWRRIVYPQRRPWITIGLAAYAMGTGLGLAFDVGAEAPLRLHVAFIHLGMIAIALGLLRVRDGS